MNSPSWTTAFLDSEYIWIHGVQIENEKRYNGDGLDFDGSRHLYISDCRIQGTDDNLCLQAGNPAYPVEGRTYYKLFFLFCLRGNTNRTEIHRPDLRSCDQQLYHAQCMERRN